MQHTSSALSRWGFQNVQPNLVWAWYNYLTETLANILMAMDSVCWVRLLAVIQQTNSLQMKSVFLERIADLMSRVIGIINKFSVKWYSMYKSIVITSFVNTVNYSLIFTLSLSNFLRVLSTSIVFIFSFTDHVEN